MSDPTSPLEELYKRGQAEQRAGRHKEAAELFRQVLAQDRASPTALCALGQSYAHLGDFTLADESFAASIAAAPNFLPAYRLGGDLAKFAGAEAERTGRKDVALQFRQGAYRYLCALGVRLVERRAWLEAEQIFREALVLMPLDWAGQVDHGRCLYELGRLEEAEAAIRRGLTLTQGKPLAHFHLGEALRRRGALADAEAQFRQALALDPQLAVAQNQLALTLSQAKRDGSP
jgi:protein O-GlcNAc transferase